MQNINGVLPDISVIVPVYKVEETYLRECLDSILAQTLNNFELIIVSDGAPLENEEIIREYAAKDSRIRTLFQENKGVCIARNEALKLVTGRYVTFIDSDDTVTADNLEGVVNYADENQLDVLMWSMYRCFSDHKTEFAPYVQDIPLFTDKQKEEVQFKTLVGILPFFVCPPASADAAGSACAKLYRMEFLRDKNLSYVPGLKRAEDMFLNLQVFDAADRIGYLHRFYYNYRQLSTSATYTYRENGIEVFTGALNEIRNHLVDKGKSDLYFQVYYMRCMFFFLESMDMDYLNPNNPKPLKVRINEMRKVAESNPYKEAFDNLRWDNLTWARRIPLFLIRHKLMHLLALFYSVYGITQKGK